MTKTILITGAGTGIGKDTAFALAQRGHQVLATTQTDAQALALQASAEAQGLKLEAFKLDITSAADRTLLTQRRIDVLINNAVYQDPEVNAMLLDLDDEALQRSLVGNVVAPFHLAKKVLPHMIAQGGGKIINVGSGAGQYDPPMAANQGGWGFAYGASKAGMGRLAGVINREWGHKGLLAFSVNPGFVNTEAAQATLGLDAELSKKYGATIPEAIAASLVWLVSDASAAELTQKPQLIDLQALIKTKALDF